MKPVPASPRRFAALAIAALFVVGGCSSSTTATPSAVPSTTASSPAESAAGSASSPTASPIPSPTFSLLTPGELFVSLTDGDMPEIAVGPNDTLLGTDGFLITEFAKKYNLKLKLFPTTLAAEILAVKQGKVDLGTTAFYKTERAQQVYYTYPFYQTVTGVFTLDSFQYTDPTSLNGKPIGTATGYAYIPFMQKTYGNDNVHIYNTIAELDQALLNGQIVAIVNGSGNDEILAANGHVVFHGLKVGDMGMDEATIQTLAYNYVNCGNKGLADALNAEMAELQASGAWQAALKANALTTDFDVAPMQSPPQLCTP